MTTERLSIEPMTLTDHLFIRELVNSPGWLRFIGERNVHSAEAAQAYVQRMLDNPQVTYWVAKLHNEKTPLGVVTLIKRHYLDHHDIGFAFLPAFSGKGYAYEAAKKVLSVLRSDLAHPQILATTLPANTSSIKLLEKLGMKFERTIQPENESLLLYSLSFDR